MTKSIRFLIISLLYLWFLPSPAIIPAAAAEAPAQPAEVMTWEDCVREAAKNNPDLVSAQQSVYSAKAQKGITGSALFPQISIDASASKSKRETGEFSDVEEESTNTFSGDISGSQLIFDGFKTSNDVAAAAENIKAAQEGYKFSSSDVRFRLRDAFTSLLKAQDSVRIKEEIFQRRRQNFELVTLRYEAGREHRGSLMTEEANLLRAKYEVVQAIRDVESAQYKLAKELGRTPPADLMAKGDFYVASAVEKPDFEKITLSHPALQRLVFQKNSAAFTLKSAKAQFFPSLTANGNVGKSDTDFPPENDSWSVGATVSVPIFEGGRRIEQIKKAEADLKKAEADEKSRQDALIRDLDSAWTGLRNAIDNAGVQKKFLAATEERARIAEAQYSTGFITFDDWIIIEDNLVSAKKSYLDAQAAALVAEAAWIQAKGETLENVK